MTMGYDIENIQPLTLAIMILHHPYIEMAMSRGCSVAQT